MLQHEKLLWEIENDIDGIEEYRLRRAILFLKCDLWTVERTLDDRKRMDPEGVAELEAERSRIKRAIDRTGVQVQKRKAICNLSS